MDSHERKNVAKATRARCVEYRKRHSCKWRKSFMYILKTEASFDSAHFLAGYNGKCSNLHGHRWKIVLEVQAEELKDDIQHKGMYVDFGELKKI